MRIVLFESDCAEALSPITLTRPAFAVLCAGTTLRQALGRLFPGAYFVHYLRDYLRLLAPGSGSQAVPENDVELWLDASVVPDMATLGALAERMVKGKSFVLRDGADVVAYYRSQVEPRLTFDTQSPWQPKAAQEAFMQAQAETLDIPLARFQECWQVVVENKRLLALNLGYFKTGFREIRPGVFAAATVQLAPSAICDTTGGPIVLSNSVVVRELAVLRGPLFVGTGTIIHSFSEVKDSSCIGEVCRIGGEVEACVVQGYSNKQHYGFLGHSYVGEWVNLGAGTTNSDLKNTYGEIKMQGKPTGQQFLGSIIADGAKTAIGSVIYTGKVLGVNAHVYGRAASDVPSFSSAVGERLVELPLEVAQKIQTAMATRRGVEITVYNGMLEYVHKATAPERKLAGVTREPLTL